MMEIEDVDKVSLLSFTLIFQSLKIIVVGNGSVGKSTLITRFARGTYRNKYKQTLGTEYYERIYSSKKYGTITLNLWDTAGQEKFDSLTRRYYRGASACLLVFSTVDRASYFAIEKWNEKVKKECGKIVTVLVETKMDLLEKSTIDVEETEGLARRLGVKLFRISSKSNFNLSTLFDTILDDFHKYDGNHNRKTIDDIELEEETLEDEEEVVFDNIEHPKEKSVIVKEVIKEKDGEKEKKEEIEEIGDIIRVESQPNISEEKRQSEQCYK